MRRCWRLNQRKTIMPFQKKNKLGKGGLRNPPGGRPTKEKQRIKKLAAILAQEFIEKNVKPVLKAYLQFAAGRNVKHRHAQTGDILWTEFEADPRVTQHYLDKLVPSPKLAPTDKEGNTVAPMIYITPNLEDEEPE